MTRKSPIRLVIAALEPSGITKVTALGLGHPDILPLWFGETDLVTPPFIRQAATQALEDGRTFYTNARGILPLREAIRDFHKRTLGADIAVERITIPGAAMLAVVTALQMVCESGDNVVIISPIWPNIFQAAKVVGAEPRLVRLDEDWSAGRWRLDLDKLFDACDARTKAMFIASPGNPTGWMLTAEEQKTILDFTRTRGIAIIADEVYGTLVYNGAAHAPSFLYIADDDDAVFAINSFSKPWAMTGWRIGWLVHPKSVEGAAAALAQCNNTGATHFVQYGALAALSPEGDAFRATLLERCRAGREMVEGWIGRQNRVRWFKPDGAFYGFLHVDGLKDSLGFCQSMVKNDKVGVSPGWAFSLGDARDDSYLRICFAQDAAKLSDALTRLEGAIR
ncbi:MAG: pyridoxal phosphate-dependent aminotransferase [Alphaproteobacteria bacterium]|nr:pyridoxal phosphate-dependent aminotransferase [Alphaproteobacteria bacterium]